LSKSSLEQYIVPLTYGYFTSKKPRSFFRTPPILQKDRPNRILYYYGYFNPPHIAHLNLLRYIFSRTHSHFNVIAAIILPLKEENCRDKFADCVDSSLLFSLEERVELWEKDAGFPEWACVLRSGHDSDWFFEALKKETKKEGFDIKYVSVIGPDYANLAGVYNYHEEVMFSDTGRPAGFVTSDGLLDLPRCTPWSVWKPTQGKALAISRSMITSLISMLGYEQVGKSQKYFDHTIVSKLKTRKTKKKGRKTKKKGRKNGATQSEDAQPAVEADRDSEILDSDTNHETTTTADDGPAIQYCRRHDKTDNVIFIPTEEGSVYRKYISSTLIRDMMSKNKSNPKEITEELAPLILGPHRKPSASVEPQTRAQVRRESA
jgi:hypothetical protein